MKITSSKFFIALAATGLCTDLLIFGIFHSPLLQIVLPTTFLTIIPGFLLLLILKIKTDNFWENALYCLGLSLTFLMGSGLFINYLLPLFGIHEPLSRLPLLVYFNVILLIFGGISFRRTKSACMQIRLSLPSLLNLLFFIYPVIILAFSIMGAISLNNGASNFFTMIMLAAIAVYVILVIIFRQRINPNLFPLSLFFIALSLLLMTSLRGWYITGHDIQREYFVFQLTKNIHLWDISLLRDPYNACLSLTILPTIYSAFLPISDMYIYKIIYQVIFAFSLIALYLAFTKYTRKIIAFLSVFYFLSFPTFINDMPMLNRQEIALVFFALIMLLLFNKNYSPKIKTILFLLFSFSLVISHYSTSYIAIALFAVTYLLSCLLRQITKQKYNLTFLMVFGLALFIFVWNSQITKTSFGLTSLVSQTWQNIGKSFSQDLKSGDTLYSLFSWKVLDKNKLLNDYVTSETNFVKRGADPGLYYPQNIYSQYPVKLVEDDVLSPTSLGSYFQKYLFDTFKFNYYLRQGIAKIIQLFVVIGFVLVIFKRSKYIKNIDPEFVLLIAVNILMLGLLIILPLFSVDYGTLRFYQQTLVILALPTLIGSLVFPGFPGEKIRLFLSSAIFIIFFLSLSGFIPQLLGDYYPQLNLNNQGPYYDSDYTHQSELFMTRWLTRTSASSTNIQTGESLRFKMLAINQQGTSSIQMLPSTIKKGRFCLSGLCQRQSS